MEDGYTMFVIYIEKVLNARGAKPYGIKPV